MSTPLLDEAARFASPCRPLVLGVDFEPHATEAPEPECVVEEEPHGVAPVSAPPVFLVPDGYAKLTSPGCLVYLEEATKPDELPARLDGEVRLRPSETVPIPLEAFLDLFERFRSRRISPARKLDLHVVEEREKARKIVAGYGAA